MNRLPAAKVDLMAILHTAYSAEAAVENKLSAVGLSLAKLAALRVLSDEGEPMPLTQLAQRLSCVKSNITQLVDRLESDGFVRRQTDGRDRRTKLAALTVAGKRACVEGVRVQQESERALLANLSGPEAQQLAELLAKVGG